MMPALEQHKAKLLLAAAAGRLPDVASIDSFWLPLFREGGHLQPLNDYWPAADRADFLPFTVEMLSDRAVAPGLAATAIFNLAAYWSEFALALVLLDSQARFTIPLGVFSFQSAYETEWQLVAAASFIGLVPMMAAFVFLQRYFVAGLTAGAVKG
jgi:hypothetical protein